MSWKQFDRLMWLMSFGDKEMLTRYIAKVEDFMKNRSTTVIFMADQIPFWVKIGSRKALYAKWETQAQKLGQMPGMQRYQRTSHKLQKQVEVEEEAAKQAEGKMTQKRGNTNVEEDKCRICLEARQAIYQWFDSDGKPVGDVMPSLLVVHGHHARASNIGDFHRVTSTG